MHFQYCGFTDRNKQKSSTGFILIIVLWTGEHAVHPSEQDRLAAACAVNGGEKIFSVSEWFYIINPR